MLNFATGLICISGALGVYPSCQDMTSMFIDVFARD
jgi:hypothetical protein